MAPTSHLSLFRGFCPESLPKARKKTNNKEQEEQRKKYVGSIVDDSNNIQTGQFTRPLLEMSANRRWAVTAGVMTGMFIAALEATVVGTAMPTVIASLGGLNHYSWVFSAYLVTSTVTVPVWGKLSDIYGRRVMYQIGIGMFLLGTLLSGFSGTMTQLIIFRAIQGLGAGALVPLGMTIIGDTFTLEERAKMQAYFSGVWGLSSVIGPVVGGFITDQISWRWVFWVNLPIGVAAALIIGVALKEPKLGRKPTIDYAGAVSLMAAISLLMLVMVEGGSSLQTLLAPMNLIVFAGALVLLILFVFVEKRAADPIIPFELFRNRTVTISVIAGFLKKEGFTVYEPFASLQPIVPTPPRSLYQITTKNKSDIIDALLRSISAETRGTPN